MALLEKLAYWSFHNLDPRAQYDYPQQSVGGSGFQGFDPAMFSQLFKQQDVRPWSERAAEFGRNIWGGSKDAWDTTKDLAGKVYNADAGDWASTASLFNPVSATLAHGPLEGLGATAPGFAYQGISALTDENIPLWAKGLGGVAAYKFRKPIAQMFTAPVTDAYKAYQGAKGITPAGWFARQTARVISPQAEAAARAGLYRLGTFMSPNAAAKPFVGTRWAARNLTNTLAKNPLVSRATAGAAGRLGMSTLGTGANLLGRAAMGPVGIGAALGDATLGTYANHVNSGITDQSMLGDENKFNNYYYKRMARTDADGLDRTNQFIQEHGKNLQGALTDSSNGLWRHVGNTVNGIFGGSGQVTNYDGYDDLSKRFDDPQREAFSAATKRVYESDPSTPEGMLAREQFRSFSDSASMKRREGEDDNARAHRLFNEAATGQGMDFKNTKGWHAQPTTPVTPTIAPTPAPEVAKATPPGGSGNPKNQGSR